MTLEELLREGCKRGLTHLTLSPTPSTDGKKIYWAAQATPSTMHKYISCAAEDPVEAILQVLQALPKAPIRSPAKPRFDEVNPPLSEMAQRAAEPVTAAVNPEPPTEIDKWLPKA